MDTLTVDQQMDMILRDCWNIGDIHDPSEVLQLAAVLKEANVIQMIARPTERVQLIAVSRNGVMAKYMRCEMTDKVKLAAVESNPWVIQYIQNPNEEMMVMAVKGHKHVIQHIKNCPDNIRELHDILWVM